MIDIQTKCRDCQAPIRLNGIVISPTTLDFSQVKSTECAKCGCKWTSVNISKTGNDTTMTEQELIELLSDAEHDSWARWMQHLFTRCVANLDKSATIPADLVERWMRQAYTIYDDLSEQEKQSDRDEVAHILPIINRYVEEKLDTLRKVGLDDIPVGESGEMLILMHNRGHAEPELYLED